MEKIRIVKNKTEAIARDEAEKASLIAARNEAMVEGRRVMEEKLMVEAARVSELEEESRKEAARIEELVQKGEIERRDGDEANEKFKALEEEKKKILELLEAEQAEVKKMVENAEMAEKAKQEALNRLHVEQEAAAEAEKLAQENTEKRLNAAVKSEAEKAALLQIVNEANALNQKKVWAERKARGEEEKLKEAEEGRRVAEEQRLVTEERRNKILLELKAVEEEAEKEMQKKLDLVKATDLERAEIKKCLKQAEAHRAVKKKAEMKLTTVAEETKKVQEELERGKLEVAKMREEARLAMEEASELKQVVGMVAEMKKGTKEGAATTRMETQEVIRMLQEQLKEQQKLVEQRVEADKALSKMAEEMKVVARKREEMEKEMKKMQEERERLEEHKTMLSQIEKEGEELKRKRVELEKKREEESVKLKEMMEKGREEADKKGEGRMMKSKGSLYELLEKKEEKPDEGKLGGLLEEDEEDGEDGDDNGDWKLKVCSVCRKKRGDLPVAHFAAASGHVDCLTYICNTDMEAIRSFDKAQRSPLFYACANMQTLTAVLLIEVAPQMVQLCDGNGDTPLHAAASSGGVELIELLVSRGGADVNGVNLLGISASHLAKERRCLEVLFDAGADIYLRDKQKRSPLFVSCAMDRRDCAEFICEIIEIEGGSLQEVDRRGDTPLHAAACNGSADCCGMLLEMGVEPGVRNKKGLRPIDLAARRGHDKCEQQLAEFHLHHASGAADFDSVMFLATLQVSRARAKRTHTLKYALSTHCSPFH